MVTVAWVYPWIFYGVPLLCPHVWFCSSTMLILSRWFCSVVWGELMWCFRLYSFSWELHWLSVVLRISKQILAFVLNLWRLSLEVLWRLHWYWQLLWVIPPSTKHSSCQWLFQHKSRFIWAGVSNRADGNSYKLQSCKPYCWGIGPTNTSLYKSLLRPCPCHSLILLRDGNSTWFWSMKLHGTEVLAQSKGYHYLQLRP